MIVSKEFKFEAAHRLTSSEAGVCAAVHGHSYRVEIQIAGPPDSKTGMVLNFKKLSEMADHFVQSFDHALILNKDDPLAVILAQDDVPEEIRLVFMNGDPTAEHMAMYFAELMQPIETHFLKVHKVIVWETAKCKAEFTS